ncbi:MAG: SusC/RagA family TonB-linked outer membrane protein [Dysgonamonadaceae bacterium]|nr:SusC/RagA family TonB-linked outer membrane protein [Dysgonamonadaceae bacterium]
MPKAKCLLVLMFFFSFGTLYSQEMKVTGTVVDENDEPLIGVTVSVVGVNLGGMTDLDGKFSLSVPKSATQLELKYLGMNDLKVPITAGAMYIKMTASTNELEEVVVSVAYGTQKRNALTGAVTSLNLKEIEQRPVTSVTALLEGKMGIMVQSETGQPGSSPSVRIRGFGSVNGSNSPLYVVDGFVYEGNITDVNSQDIAEVSVLKDASSAAIYGNRAANGVIIITTKKGSSEKPHISLVMNQGLEQRNIPDYERLGVDPWMEATWMGYRNQFISSQKKTVEEANALANANLIPNYLKYNIYDRPDNQLFDANGKLTGQVREGFRDDLDWFEAGTRNGRRQEYIVSGDGRIGAKSDYYFSAGYLDQQGYTPDADFKRFSGRAKINLIPVKWFKMGFNIAATNQEKLNMVQSGSGYTSLFHHARNIPPIYPVHLHDMTTGEYILDEAGNKKYDNGVENGRPQLPNRHTIWENQLNSRNVARKTMVGNLFAEISFLNDFKLKVSGNLDTQVNEGDTYENALIGDAFSLNGRISFSDNRYKSYTFLQQLTYNKTINDHYNLDVLAAHENFSYNDVSSSGGKTDEIFAGLPYMVNFTTMTSLNGYEDNRRTESYLSRVQLNYDEKYFLDGSFRRDGSSRFDKRNRWGNFYSVGAAWNIAKEAFMDGIDPVNYLKLRANYGETGNDASVGMYGYMALYNLSQNAMHGALIKSQLEALDIKWEASTSFGLALDGRVFDRLNFSVEYFDKRSRDLLFNVLLPQSAGAYDSKSPVVTKNIGSASNRGVELNLSADIIRTKDFVWQAELNATMLKNKILILPEENREKGIIAGNKKYTEGHGIYDFWTYQYVGIDQMTGRSLYELNADDYYVADPNGAPAPAGETRTLVPADNTININGVDYVYKTTYARRDFSGSAIPKLTGTFSTGANYNGITLSVLFSYGLGNKVMDDPYRDLMQMGGSLPTAFHKDVLKSWNGVPAEMTADSPNRIDRNATPILDPTYSSDNNAVSNRWLINGSYLMFKNINLSYSLPKNWIQSLDLSAVRVNLTAENLHLFSARKGLNSQMSFNGEIANQASAPRVISMGIKVDF